jgi:hypothetical protein
VNPLFTFDTTHHALWAEEIARAKKLGAEVVPAPAWSNAKCSLALEVLPEDLKELQDALDSNGVHYALHNVDP